MNLEKVKNYLQDYLETVVVPKINSDRHESGRNPIKFSVHEILMGSYNPPMVHIFVDTEPLVKKDYALKPHAYMMLSEVEKSIENFIKVFSINNRIKIHWNKRPIFKNDTLHTEY